MTSLNLKDIDVIETAKDAVEIGEDVVVNPKGFWRTKKFWLDLVTSAAHIVRGKKNA